MSKGNSGTLVEFNRTFHDIHRRLYMRIPHRKTGMNQYNALGQEERRKLTVKTACAVVPHSGRRDWRDTDIEEREAIKGKQSLTTRTIKTRNRPKSSPTSCPSSALSSSSTTGAPTAKPSSPTTSTEPIPTSSARSPGRRSGRRRGGTVNPR